MVVNKHNGLFVAFDGPDGVGKTTIVHELGKRLNTIGFKVLTTKESTENKIGEFIMEYCKFICDYPLACLVAADRYEHLDEIIIPALRSGFIVLCDRYFLSSLILQRLDGVDKKFIIDINRNILFPDLQIALLADEKTLYSRLSKRKKITRFETRENICRQLYFFEDGIKYLKSKRIPVESFNTTAILNNTLDEIIDIINRVATEKGILPNE